MPNWVHWARRYTWSLPANTQSLNLISLSSSGNTHSLKRCHSQQSRPHLTRIRFVTHQVVLLDPNKGDSCWSVWLRWKGTYSLRVCVSQDSSLRLLCGIMTELELPATSRKIEKIIIQRWNGFLFKVSSDVRASWYSVNIFMSWCAPLSFGLGNFWTLNCSFLISCVLLTEQTRYHPLLELSSFCMSRRKCKALAKANSRTNYVMNFSLSSLPGKRTSQRWAHHICLCWMCICLLQYSGWT